MGEKTGKPLGRFTAFFVWLSGHSVTLTEEVPTAEQVRITALGMTLLLPVGIASAGAFATAYRISHGSVEGAAIASVVVGLFTLIIDRALMASFSRNFGSLALRVVLTLVTSTVFAHTALLWLFGDKITEQAEEKRKVELEEITRRFTPKEAGTNALVSRQNESLTRQMESLTSELKNSSEMLSKTSAELGRFRQKYNDEIEGKGASKIAGEGPAARRLKREHIEPLERELAFYQGERERLQRELSGIREELASLYKASENDPEKTRAQAQLEQLTEEVLNRSYLGVLSQFVLLHEVIKKDSSALVAYVLVSLLLLLWELIPVLLKFSGDGGEYERKMKALKMLREAELEVSKDLLEQKARLLQGHALRLETMDCDEIEAEKWLKQADARFQVVQEKRASIPRRATAEQREAYLAALNVLIDSLTRTAEMLGEKKGLQ